MKLDSYGEWVEALADGRLPEERRQELQEHLSECPSCRSYQRFLEGLRRASSQMEIQKAPESMANKVLMRLWKRDAMENSFSIFFKPAMAFGIAFFIALGYWWGQKQSRPHDVVVRLTLDAPRANHVAVAGDFNDWRPQSMARDGGVWVGNVRLQSGRYQYIFILNHRTWMLDPRASEVTRDAKGQPIGILDVNNL